MSVNQYVAKSSAPAAPIAPPEPDAGWSLLELLVGLLLLSLLSIMLVESLTSFGQAMRQYETRSEAIDVEAVETYLRRTLSAAYPVKPGNIPADTPLLDAGASKLGFITSYAPAGQFGGLYAIAWERIPSHRPGQFDFLETRTLYRAELVSGGLPPNLPSTKTRLLRNIDGFRLAYFGAREDREAPSWGTDWTDATRLPALVKVDVIFRNGDQRKWPPLVVALPVGQ